MLQTKILQLFGPLAPTDSITKTCVRYACRLCSSSQFSELYRLPLTSEQRQAIRALKDWFDHSCYRNTLFHALWTLAQQKRPGYQRAGRTFGLDPDDLHYQFKLLSLEDRNELRQHPEPKHFTAAQIAKTIHGVERYSRFLVKRYLRYCYNNDAGIDREDFWAELNCQALKIIRKYEVLDMTVEKITPLVARGISNHVKNLAIYYGKDRRNPLVRVEERNDTREAWYCNVSAETIEHVWVYVDQQHRKGNYYLAEFDDRSPAYIYCKRLFDTAEEADEALLDYRRGRGTVRGTVVDLTSSRTDDWQPALTSLDTPSQENGAPLLNFISEDSSTTETSQIADIAKDFTDPKKRLFFDAVSGDLGLMFDRYCIDTTGKSFSELSEAALTRVAGNYCGIQPSELVQN